MRQPKTGFDVDNPILVTQGSAQIGSLAINNSWVAFGEDTHWVWKGPITGGPSIEVSAAPTYIGDVAISNNYIFWTVYGFDVWRMQRISRSRR